MDLRIYTLGILALLPLLLTAGEVTENTQNSPLTTLLSHFNEVKVNIDQNGTIRLTGHLADRLNGQVVSMVEASREESREEERAAAALLNPSRGPAIVSADGISSGEVSPVDYASFGVPSQTTRLDNEESLKGGSFGAGGTGNLGSVAAAIKKFDDASAGRLPIPFNIAPTSISATQPQPKSVDSDKAGTTFGKNPSDESSISNLMASKRGLNAAKDALAKEAQELAGLKDKDKEQEEKEKKEAELKDKMSKVKDLISPYDIKDYLGVRDLFNDDPDQMSQILEQDPAFQEKAAEIFGFVPEGASKSLGDLDSDRKRKQKYLDFIADFNSGKDSKFPSKPVEPANRIRVERAH